MGNNQNIGELDLQEDGYQVLVVNIAWNRSEIQQYRGKHERYEDLPKQFALDIPDGVLAQARKKSNSFNDIIETFVYNFFAHKYGYEVNFCQIWLPFEDNEQAA